MRAVLTGERFIYMYFNYIPSMNSLPEGAELVDTQMCCPFFRGVGALYAVPCSVCALSSTYSSSADRHIPLFFLFSTFTNSLHIFVFQ